MKYILLIFVFNFSFAQKEIPSDAKHFYASVGLCELSYHSQKYLLPKQKEHNRFLISVFTSLSFGISKELFDKYRCNRSKRTGFDRMDLFTDSWGITCWIPFRICLNDFKKNKNSIYQNK